LEFAKQPEMVCQRLEYLVLQTKVLGHENAESFLMTAMDPPKTSTVDAASKQSLSISKLSSEIIFTVALTSLIT
jgi:HrpA-like RNA helicase